MSELESVVIHGLSFDEENDITIIDTNLGKFFPQSVSEELYVETLILNGTIKRQLEELEDYRNVLNQAKKEIKRLKKELK